MPRKRECPLLPHLTRVSAPNGRLPGAKSEEQNKKLTYHTSLCLLLIFLCVHIIVQIQGQIWPDFARTFSFNIFGDRRFSYLTHYQKIETNPPGTVRDSSISTERWWSAAGNQCAPRRDETQSRLSADFGDVQPYVRFIYRCVCVCVCE